MHFLTAPEARAWCEGRVPLTDAGLPERPGRAARHARGPAAPEVAFARQVEAAIRPWAECLLWVTEAGVWPSSENLHLYYRLRQSYGDRRRLADAPGHLFLDYEAADLVSFLQVGVLCGWDMHLVPAEPYARAFVSHDEFVELAGDGSDPDRVAAFAAELGGAEVRSPGAA